MLAVCVDGDFVCCVFARRCVAYTGGVVVVSVKRAVYNYYLYYYCFMKPVKKYTVCYWWACIPAVILLLAWLPGMQFSRGFAFVHLVHPLGSFAWGLLVGFAYLFVVNHIETRRRQHIFFIFSAVTLPFIGFGVFLGGLIGAFGIALFTAVPLFVLLVFVGGVLYKSEQMVVRLVISVIAFLLLAGVGVWGFLRISMLSRMTLCSELSLGTWDETEKICAVDPAQAVRNAIFFSDVFIEQDDVRIAFSAATDEILYDQPGDLLASVYRKDGTEGVESARYQADLAVVLDDLVVVPVAVSNLGDGSPNTLYVVSLVTHGGLSLQGIPLHRMAGFVEIDGGVEMISLRQKGSDGAIVAKVRKKGFATETLNLSVSTDGSIAIDTL